MFIDIVRAVTAKLPGVTEDIKWEHDLCFCIRGKLFFVMPVEGKESASFKVPDEAFEELCTREGIIPAPYMARNKWIHVNSPKVFSKKEWEYYIRQSYQLVAVKLPVKVKKELGVVG